VCCSVLQSVAVCCSVKTDSDRCNASTAVVSIDSKVDAGAIQRVAACCSVLQRVAVCCSVRDGFDALEYLHRGRQYR